MPIIKQICVGCVSFLFFREHCNTTGRLRICVDSDLVGNVTDDACVRIRSDDLEAVNCACSGLTVLKGSWKRVDVYDTIFIAND